jgi:DNA-directed RNA polymerase subunit alpha
LEGHAITTVRIDGVDHEFSTIKGVIEDMTEIVLNLKQVRFRRQLDDVSTEKVSFTVTGKDSFTAGDIGKHTTGFQVLNPDLVIAHMETNVKLTWNSRLAKAVVMCLPMRTRWKAHPSAPSSSTRIFTPIKNVKYTVENTRVEEKTDYEKLTIEVCSPTVASVRRTHCRKLRRS